jgi:hypothetical protein
MAIVLAMGLSPARASLSTLTVDTPLAKADGTADIGGGFKVSGDFLEGSGTGHLQPFLRMDSMNVDFERGYNTSTGFPLDDKPPVNYTHAISLSMVPIVNLSGTNYREFLLDANQSMNGDISLNQVQIFQSNADVGLGYSLQEADATHNAIISFPSPSPANSLVFQMSNRTIDTNNPGSTVSNQVLVNSGNGSGTLDMALYVQDSLFTNRDPNSFVTLFSQFGTPPGGFVANDGFEDWKTNLATALPEPSTLAMAGLGALGFIGYGLRRRPKK